MWCLTFKILKQQHYTKLTNIHGITFAVATLENQDNHNESLAQQIFHVYNTHIYTHAHTEVKAFGLR